MLNNQILEIVGLKKYFDYGNNMVLKAVDNISFGIKKGETLGLVGESGCGKTTTGRLIVRLYRPTEGKIIYEGGDISCLDKGDVKKYTKKVQMIFQDPYASLDPRMTVGEIIGEGINIHNMYNKSEKKDRINQLLDKVGLSREHANRFPHEFSGGQRQRIGIARALAVEPNFIVCDEPISALDVSIQAQIVNLLINLQEEFNLTYLFIAHNLSMVKHISNRVAVMYLGSIVEITTSEELYRNPLHPYTQALLSSIPIPDPLIERERKRMILSGDVPSPINIPPGCKFRDRCFRAAEGCMEKSPELREVSPGHFLACNCVD